MEDVRLDRSVVVMECDFFDTRPSWPIFDDPEISPPDERVVKLAVGGSWDLDRLGFKEARVDSTAHLRVPDPDVDSETIHEIDATFHVGRRGVLVLLGGEGSVSREALLYVGRRAAREIRKIDFDEGPPFYDIGRTVRNAALDVLDGRIERIEASVRDALGDEQFSDLDLMALQTYPERLARVEAAARSLREKQPSWESSEPPSQFAWVGQATDRFSESAADRAGEARTATGRLATLISSQQIVLNQRQARSTARFQRTATIVGAAVLVPGLVAAVFGANVGFHGRGGTSAFWAMLALMAGGALVSYATIRALEVGLPARVASRLPGRLRSVSPTLTLGVAALLGLVLLALGIAVLLS